MMTEKIFIDIRFSGDGFSPKTLMKLTNWPLEILAETGETAKTGRYRGDKSPYGLALLKLGQTSDDILKWSAILLSNKVHLDKSNVKEIIFDIEASNDNLSDLSISPIILKNLSQLNAQLKLNVIEEETVEELISKLIFHIDKNPSINNYDVIHKKLLDVRNSYAHNHISSQVTYGLIMYLLQTNTHTINKTHSFESYLEEYNNL